MAQRGRPIPASTLRTVLRVARDVSIRGAARAANVAPNTVRKYVRQQRG